MLQNGDYSFPSCIVSGLPIPTVTWLKNGNPLENDDSTSIQESFIMEAGTTSINSTLILSGLTVKDNGHYVCRAENYLARVDMAKGYTLTVKGYSFIANPQVVNACMHAYSLLRYPYDRRCAQQGYPVCILFRLHIMHLTTCGCGSHSSCFQVSMTQFCAS